LALLSHTHCHKYFDEDSTLIVSHSKMECDALTYVTLDAFHRDYRNISNPLKTGQ